MSASYGSGKSTALDVTENLMANPIHLEAVTEAVLRNLTNDLGYTPTFAFDELDELVGKDGEKAGAGHIVLMWNTGYKHSGGTWFNRQQPGGGVKMMKASSFAPIVFAGATFLPKGTLSRAITIPMLPALPDDIFDPWEEENESEALPHHDAMALWAMEHFDALKAFRMPRSLSLYNRGGEIWRPLFAIAESLGGHWPETCRRAADHFMFQKRAEMMAENDEMIRDLADVFKDGETFLPTQIIRERLIILDGSTWSNYLDKGQPISEGQIKAIVTRHNIPSIRKRMEGEENPRHGYNAAAFADLFLRVSGPIPQKSTQPTQPAQGDVSAGQRPANCVGDPTQEPTQALDFDTLPGTGHDLINGVQRLAEFATTTTKGSIE